MNTQIINITSDNSQLNNLIEWYNFPVQAKISDILNRA